MCFVDSETCETADESRLCYPEILVGPRCREVHFESLGQSRCMYYQLRELIVPVVDFFLYITGLPY